MDVALLGWLLLLGLGFPLIGLLLSEASERLESGQPALSSALRKVLQYVLPPLAVLLIMRQLLQIASDENSSRLVETVTWIAIITASVSLINAVFTTSERTNQRQLRVPNLFFQVARAVAVLAIGFHIVGGVWAVDLSGIVTAVGVSSLVVALALQDTLSNLVSGLLLLIAKPFKLGDWIIFNGIKGRVIEQNWWGVTLEHRGWQKTISVPNGVLSKATIDNFGDDGFWYSVEIEFSYDDPPNRVLAALNGLNRGFEELELDQFLYDLNLYVGIQEFGASGIKYVIWYKRTSDRKNRLFKNYFLSRIYHMAQREGFTIPYPISVQYTVDATDGLPAEIPQVSVSRENEIVSYLRALPYFLSLDQEDIDDLANKIQVKEYGLDEVIVQAGKPDEGFYIVYHGQARILAKSSQSKIVGKAGILKEGDSFGEMALFPGEVSPVTVIANTDAELLLIETSTMVELIQNRSKFGFEMIRFIDGKKRNFDQIHKLSRLTKSSVL
ncbi:MAG: mechanosensitive ion channel family protein [Cyanobacteria bacterium P01_H01_bin.105]